jgi:hypothetical protein
MTTLVDVPHDEWAVTAQSGSSANTEFTAGHQCVILMGATAEILGKDNEFGYLIRYSSPIIPGGTLCPSLLLWVPHVEAWPPTGTVNASKNETDVRRADAVRRILAEQPR